MNETHWHIVAYVFLFHLPPLLMNTFKIVKPLENGYLVQECILTKQGENLVKDLTDKWMSQEWIASVLMPYDSVKKQQVKDSKLVSTVAQYFKKTI